MYKYVCIYIYILTSTLQIQHLAQVSFSPPWLDFGTPPIHSTLRKCKLCAQQRFGASGERKNRSLTEMHPKSFTSFLFLNPPKQSSRLSKSVNNLVIYHMSSNLNLFGKIVFVILGGLRFDWFPTLIHPGTKNEKIYDHDRSEVTSIKTTSESHIDMRKHRKPGSPRILGGGYKFWHM